MTIQGAHGWAQALQEREFQKFTWDASMPADWKTLDGQYYHLYNDDASWGPRMVGQELHSMVCLVSGNKIHR